MSPLRFLAGLALFSAVVVLAACGNKGPLVKPGTPPQPTTQPAPSGAEPSTPDEHY